MIKIILFISLCLYSFAVTGSQLSKPSSTVYDLTFSPGSIPDVQTFKSESVVEKAFVQIGEVTKLTRRTPNIFSCGFDGYGNEYCPSSLAKASEYWDYEDGFSERIIGQVTDYASKVADTNIENTSSICMRSTGSLIAESPSNQWSIDIPAWQGSNGAGFTVYINKISDAQYRLYYRLRADYGYTEWRTVYVNKGGIFQDTWANGRDVTGFKIDLTKAVFYGFHPKTLATVGAWDLQNMPVCKNCGSNLAATQLTQSFLPNLGGSGWLLNNSQGGSTISLELSSDKKRYYYKIQAGTDATKISTGNFITSIRDSVFSYDGKWNYSINFELTEGYVRIGQYGNYNIVYSFNDLVCYLMTSSCPGGYTTTAAAETSKGQCKKLVDYNYYSYYCSDSINGQNNNFVAILEGGNIERTDPDNTVDNTVELSLALNSSTPPTNNCRRQGFSCNQNIIKPAFIDGTWQCSPYLCEETHKCGYATCSTGTTPSTNLYQDAAYNVLGADHSGVCNGPVCDYVANSEITFCTSGACPNGSEYETINGKCYKKECPAGTYDSNGTCLRQN